MKNDKTVLLKSRWEVGTLPLSEYPRPQLERESYVNLNGFWDYAIKKTGEPYTIADGKILVPYSPECLLSDVQKTLKPEETLFYERTFVLEKDFNVGRVILHFGAVDSEAEVFLNGTKIGTHSGGYNSFFFDITAHLKPENVLRVAVTDPTDTSFITRAKQTFRRGGIWYSPSSGIWQTVWLESVPDAYIKNITVTPDFDNSEIFFAAEVVDSQSVDAERAMKIAVEVFDGGKLLCRQEGQGGGITLKLDGFNPWSPECPNLYTATVTVGKDSVKTYFGMRKYEVREDKNGVMRFHLNNEPYFMHGLLDQGYFSDGMYTAPSDAALRYDVELTKCLGYNTLRKHIKVEPMRWYYHCDTLGVIVWQDMPSGGTPYKRRVTMYYPFINIKLRDKKYKLFGRADKDGRDAFYTEYREMIQNLKNVVSLAVWVPFNEGWGQFDANRAAELTKELDKTRLVDHASGWHDQKGGDFRSLHIYFKKVPKMTPDGKRAAILSEFGGFSRKVEGHSFNLTRTFGYKVFSDDKSLNEAFIKLYENEVSAHIKEGLSADIYTQLSDVEDEVNGVVSYDRAVLKITQKSGATVKEQIEREMQKLKEGGRN